ncbi:DNA-processing protein DprA [Candidatus Kaiserbacteria bacterium]|nr:DNA-processing protein DprA [Candidatus Kaiserbacteria bacterium]
MSFLLRELKAEEFPALLREIPQPPKQLNLRGSLPSQQLKLLSIVGSRKYTTYGKDVVNHLLAGLANYPIGIVSGLALGIDSLAHEAALANNLYTLAIPGGGLDDKVIYPAKHKPLAYRIMEAGGGLLSEFEPNFKATKWSFPQRNRLVAGISYATLLIEAEEKSGTLITARLATDYNRELLVVPGNIFSKNTAGTHQFLKLGAIAITTSEDILDVFGISKSIKETSEPVYDLSETESAVIDLLHEPKSKDDLIRLLKKPTNETMMLLMQMEMKGYITESGGLLRAII